MVFINGFRDFYELSPGSIILVPPPNVDAKTLEPPKSPYTENFKPSDFPGRRYQKGLSYLGREVNLRDYFISNRLWKSTDPNDPRAGYPIHPKHRALYAISQNEGGFLAINNAERNYMSVGILQWSAHSGDLQNLLFRFKKEHPKDFENEFQTYGINVESQKGKTYLTFLGVRLEGEGLEWIRNEWFAHIFSKAGKNPAFQQIQVQMALERLDEAINLVHGTHLTPEGMAHIFDMHVFQGHGAIGNFLDKLSIPKGKTFLEAFLKARKKKWPFTQDRINRIEEFFKVISIA